VRMWCASEPGQLTNKNAKPVAGDSGGDSNGGGGRGKMLKRTKVGQDGLYECTKSPAPEGQDGTITIRVNISSCPNRYQFVGTTSCPSSSISDEELRHQSSQGTQTGEVTYFKVKRSCDLGKVFNALCATQGRGGDGIFSSVRGGAVVWGPGRCNAGYARPR
jgi:hypothetical protein